MCFMRDASAMLKVWVSADTQTSFRPVVFISYEYLKTQKTAGGRHFVIVQQESLQNS